MTHRAFVVIALMLAFGGAAFAQGARKDTASGNGSAGNVAIRRASSDSVLYVSGDGNDSDDGLSWRTAKATIPAALSALPSGGGDIWVGGSISSWAGGTIPANVRVHFAVSAISLTAPVALSSNDTLDCAYGRQLDVSPFYSGTIFTISGFTSRQDAISASQADGITIRGCTIKMTGGGRRGIYLAGVSDALIARNTIVDPGEDGIRVDNAGQQSYDDTFFGDHVIHAAGDYFSFRTDGGTLDLDRMTLIDDACSGVSPGGTGSAGTNCFHFLVPSGAASTQSIADVELINSFGHLSGAAVNELYLDYEGTNTTATFMGHFHIAGEYEKDESGGACTAITVKDAAAANIDSLDVSSNSSCSTYLTNVDSSHVENYRVLGVDRAANSHYNLTSTLVPATDNTDTLGLDANDWANIFSYKYTVIGAGDLQNVINGQPCCGGVASTLTFPNTSGTIAVIGSGGNAGISAGTVTLSDGFGSHNFGAAYSSAPICTAADTTAANPVQATSSTTAVTLTGSATDVIAWICSPTAN